MKSRIEIKAQAKDNFMRQRGIAILAFVLYTVITSVLSGATVGIAMLFLMPPLTVGYAYFCLRLYRGETCEISDMLSTGFRDYVKSLVGILWMYLFTIFVVSVVCHSRYYQSDCIFYDSIYPGGAGRCCRQRRIEAVHGDDIRTQDGYLCDGAIVHRLVAADSLDLRYSCVLFHRPLYGYELSGAV